MDNYVFHAPQTCSLSVGSGKAIICLCNNFKTPWDTYVQDLKKVLCFMSYEAALELYVCSGMSGSGHLSSYLLLLQLHSENPAALHWTSVCCYHLMNDCYRVKMTAVLCKMLTRISLHINLDLGDSMCSFLQQHIDNSFAHDAKGSRYYRQCGWKLQINAVCAH